MYAFAKLRGDLARFSCFALEGSHRRLKRILRNSGVGLCFEGAHGFASSG